MSAPCYLGLETGGTKLVACVLTEDLTLLSRKEVQRPAAATAEATLAQLAALAGIVQAAAGRPEVQAIGWGFGGPVDRRRNRPLINFHESGWENLDAAGRLQAELGLPVFIENDCKVAALAEAISGAGSVHGLTAYLTLGSGVGGGLVFNGRILKCGPCGEGEIGHLCIEPGGAMCACGRRGCLEAYCSGWGVGERAAEKARNQKNPTPVSRRILQAEPRERAAILFSGWPTDPFSREQIEAFLARLARACTSLCLLVAPARVVIGGGLARQTWLPTELGARVVAELPGLLQGHTQFIGARLGAGTVSWGAALYARECLRAQGERNGPHGLKTA